MIFASFDLTFEGWRQVARRLLAAGVSPENVLWTSEPPLFASDLPIAKPGSFVVPRDFLTLADLVACHSDEAKWPTLYRVLFRLANGERHLLEIESDPDINVLYRMRKQITHDMHRMKAFVRFRQVDGHFVAWHKPDHRIVEKMGLWFAERFGNMAWSILTPDRSAHWDGRALIFGPGVPASEAPAGDALEDLWRTYYASTFNPARVNEKLLRTHVPGRHWATMPETSIIPELIVSAKSREQEMRKTNPISAANFIPANPTLAVLGRAVQDCRGCDLYQHATQAVPGHGRLDASLVLIGEQPGNQEDLEGLPFVGPAGQILDRALTDAEVDRGELYLTNAVRHFRFEERGKRRIHKTPTRGQVAACQPWLDAELALLRPKLIVCLGATALLSVVGRAAKVSDFRRKLLPNSRYAGAVTATVHPSYLLRVTESKEEEYRKFVGDLRFARRYLENGNREDYPAED